MTIEKAIPADVMPKLDAESIEYDKKHGGPYDRGSADSYYRRLPEPHYWPLGTGSGKRVEKENMTDWQIRAYWAGYDDNEQDGNFKEY